METATIGGKYTTGGVGSPRVCLFGLGVMVVKGSKRVMRGGSWINNGRNVRSAYRNHNSPGNRNDNFGFRLSLAHNRIGITVIDQTRPRFFRRGKNK